MAAADGNFLYVRLLAQEISDGARSLDDVEALPVGLFPLYSEYLDRVTGTEPGQPPRSKWARELHRWSDASASRLPPRRRTFCRSGSGRMPDASVRR